MKAIGNKRKMDHTDGDVIPGTPQDKQSKKKQRKKSNKCVDCDDLLLDSGDLVIKESITNNDLNQTNVEDLLNGIDFLDDFNCENVQVSRSSFVLKVYDKN